MNLFTAYCVLRFRHRKGNTAHYEPESKKLEIILTAFTTVGVAAMLTPGLFVWGEFVTVPEDATRFEAVGKQWHWSFRLPGADGQLGNSDVRHMTVDNPLGVDPEDPTGQDDIVIAAPTMHLPVNQSVNALLRSTDVLHDFAVPQFRVKMDLVPGLVTYQWFKPTVPGTYEILCEELCGTGHFAMRGKIVVDEPAAYQSWLAKQQTFAQTQARPVGNPTAGATNFAVCSACHGPQGEGNQQTNGPKLAGLNDWYIRRQLQHYQTGIRGSDATRDPIRRADGADVADGARRNRARERDRVHQHAPRHARADYAERRCRTRREAVRDVQRVPRRRRQGPVGHERTEARGHERLVSRASAAFVQGSRARRSCRGHLRRSDELGVERRSATTSPSRTSSRTSTRCANRRIRSLGQDASGTNELLVNDSGREGR